MPLLAVEPQDPSPGDVITVTFPGACAVVVPPEGLRISAAPVDDRAATVRTTVPTDAEEPLRAEIRLPDDFPTGSASVGLDGYPSPPARPTRAARRPSPRSRSSRASPRTPTAPPPRGDGAAAS